ncbi:hypothetical protein GCM10025734_67770 [Kitasatospora paranensis]
MVRPAADAVTGAVGLGGADGVAEAVAPDSAGAAEEAASDGFAAVAGAALPAATPVAACGSQADSSSVLPTVRAETSAAAA